MKRIAILTADGFEDLELIGTIDHWKRAGIEFEIFSIQNKLKTKGSFFASVETKEFNMHEVLSFDALFIPGGKSKEKFDSFGPCLDIINDFYKKEKGVFAICAAPFFLYKAGILKDKKFTCWPGLNIKESTNSEFEVDGNIITGRDYIATLKFAEAVVKYIKK